MKIDICVDPGDEFFVVLTFEVGEAEASLTFDDTDDAPDLDIKVQGPDGYGRLRRSNGVDLLRAIRAAVKWCEDNGISSLFGCAYNAELLSAYERIAARYRGPVKIFLSEI